MDYAKITKSDFEDWLMMGLTLWPDYSRDHLKKELKGLLKSKKQQTFIAKDGSSYVGFINISIRNEYTEGATSYPIGYVEGIYVKPNYRKNRVASKLIECGERWLLERGCKEIGSDTWLWNKDSQAFHKKLGFQEKETIVHFIKKINAKKC